MSSLAENLRQLMASAGLRTQDVAAASGLSVRTVKGILVGETPRPHACTLRALADGLGVTVQELFQASDARGEFDRATNPVVDQVIADHPRLFHDWHSGDFAELYSRFGAGGTLSYAGALTAAAQMNAKRQRLHKALLVLESDEAELLGAMIDMLYDRVAVRSPEQVNRQSECASSATGSSHEPPST